MIAFSKMTLREAVEEVFMRLGEMATTSNMDHGYVVRAIRNARRELMSRAIPVREQEFYSRILMTDGDPAPPGFVRPVRCLYSPSPGSIEYTEARLADPREWPSVAIAANAHTFNKGTVTEPVYMFWASNVASNTAWVATNMILWTWPAGGQVLLEYVAQFDDADLAVDADLVNVPVGLEPLLINLALYRCYLKLNEMQSAELIFITAMRSLAEIERQNAVTNVAAAMDLESQPDPEPASLPQQRGE